MHARQAQRWSEGERQVAEGRRVGGVQHADGFRVGARLPWHGAKAIHAAFTRVCPLEAPRVRPGLEPASAPPAAASAPWPHRRASHPATRSGS
eukprot:scaffold2645_cov112-Isochrysis_galbana.AAC.7